MTEGHGTCGQPTGTIERVYLLSAGSIPFGHSTRGYSHSPPLGTAMEKGITEGKYETNTETAQRLLAMGLSAEQVSKATQLPLEIIKNLSNS